MVSKSIGRPSAARYGRWFEVGVSGSLILFAFVIRLYRLDAQSIWWDEGHSLQMASAPIAQIPTLPGMDVHPPGYFVALHGWISLIGDSQFSIRYLSLCFSLLTVALLLRFGRVLGGLSVGWWAALLTAVSPFYVAYAQEVRMYAMVTFWATASVYFLWRFLQDKDPLSHLRGKLWLIGYVLTTTLSLYTHYFTLFLIAFQNVVWLIWLWRGHYHSAEPQLGHESETNSMLWSPQLSLWLGSQLAIFLLFIPQLRLATRQIGGYANPNLNPPGLIDFISQSWQAYTSGLTIDPTMIRPYLIVIALVLIGGVFLHLGDKRFLFLVTWLIIPLGLYYLILQSRPSFEPRYMMLVTPSIFLLLGLTVANSGRIMPILGIGLAAVFVVGLYHYFNDVAFFKDDAEAVTRWLGEETTANDIVFVDVPHPFDYYAKDIPAPVDYLFVDIHTAADVLNEAALGRDHFYWVTWWGSDTDPRGVIPYLLQKQAGPEQASKQFRGYHVVRYDLSDQPFSLPTDLSATEVNFDNVLLLNGLAYSQQLELGQAGWVTVEFLQMADMAVNYKLSLRLRTPTGEVLSQTDKLILNDRHFQTADWPIDDPALNRGINVFALPLADPTYRGPLILEAVVYNADDLASIAAYGVPTTNDDLVSAQIGQVEVH